MCTKLCVKYIEFIPFKKQIYLYFLKCYRPNFKLNNDVTIKAKLVYFGDRIFYPYLNKFRSVIIKMYCLIAQGRKSDEMYTQYNHVALYSYAPHNDVSVNDGTHIRRWSHKITIL